MSMNNHLHTITGFFVQLPFSQQDANGLASEPTSIEDINQWLAQMFSVGVPGGLIIITFNGERIHPDDRPIRFNETEVLKCWEKSSPEKQPELWVLKGDVLKELNLAVERKEIAQVFVGIKMNSYNIGNAVVPPTLVKLGGGLYAYTYFLEDEVWCSPIHPSLNEEVAVSDETKALGEKAIAEAHRPTDEWAAEVKSTYEAEEAERISKSLAAKAAVAKAEQDRQHAKAAAAATIRGNPNIRRLQFASCPQELASMKAVGAIVFLSKDLAPAGQGYYATVQSDVLTPYLAT